MLKTVALIAPCIPVASSPLTPAIPFHDEISLRVADEKLGLRTVGVLRAVALIGPAAALFVVKSLTRNFDHDENQFVASGYLLAHGGLLPYRDYPYFHTPYLTIVYAALFRWTSHLLLSARLCSVLCGITCYGAVLWCVAAIRPARKWLLYSTAIIFVAQPLVFYTSGRAWNHDMPVLLTLLAFLALGGANRSPRKGAWLLGAGLLAGLATGMRITFLVTLPAICLCVLLDDAPHAGVGRVYRIRQQLAVMAGFALAMIPLAGLVAEAPGAFVFDNFRYPLLNLQWRRATEGLTDGLFAAKGRFILSAVLNQPGNVGLLVLFVAAMLPLAVRSGGPKGFAWETRVLGILSGALLVGAIIPTPTFMPYFYAPVPFMLLAAVYAAAGCEGRRLVLWRRCFIGVAIASVPMGLAFYGAALEKIVRNQCTPLKMHDTGVQAAALAGRHPILTLSPIFAMEGGAKTYSQFATGPFAFRIAPLVSEAEEAQDHLPDPDDLERMVGADRPGLVVIGDEGQSEQPLIAYAHEHGTRAMFLSDDGGLFERGKVPAMEPHQNWSNVSRYFVDKARRIFAGG